MIWMPLTLIYEKILSDQHVAFDTVLHIYLESYTGADDEHVSTLRQNWRPIIQQPVTELVHRMCCGNLGSKVNDVCSTVTYYAFKNAEPRFELTLYYFLLVTVGKVEVNLVWVACNQDQQVEGASHGEQGLVYAFLRTPAVILLGVGHYVSWTVVITWVEVQGNISIRSGTTLEIHMEPVYV